MTRNAKRVLGLVMAAALAVNIAPGTEAKAAKKAALKTKSVNLSVGKTKKIVIKNKKKGAKYLFRSSAPKKASVSAKGVIKGKKAGNAKITVQEKYRKKTKKIGTVKVSVKRRSKVQPTNQNTAAPTAASPSAPSASGSPAAGTPATGSSQAPGSTPEITVTATPEPTVEPTPEPTPEIAPPDDYKERQDDVTYGAKTDFTYDSTTTGTTRHAYIVLPAGYTESKEYPVVYLLHGIGGDENEWFGGKPVEIVGNLIAKGEAKEMIMVFPNIRCRANDKASGELSVEHFQAFDNFINDLRDNLMPYVESHYSVAKGRENTAVAGLSMGGRESLYIGLSMPETFGYIGGFEPAVGVLPYATEDGLFTEETMTLPDEYKNNTYIMIVKGNEDGTVGEWPRTYHETLEKNGVPHTYYEMPGGHDFSVWSNGLYNFAKRAFK